MGVIRPSQRIKIFTGIITRHRDLLPDLVATMSRALGPVDGESPEYPFDLTDYYAESMGEGLIRKFYSFESLRAPDGIAEIKRESNRWEDAVARSGKYPEARPVNIDPGYVTEGKIILLTTKDYSHRIYLDGGIFAEVTMIFRHGGFQKFEWTFPDFRSGRYDEYFVTLRERYRAQIASGSG